MQHALICARLLFLVALASAFSSANLAQLPPANSDPLNKRNAPGQGALACSAADASSCVVAAAKILPQVMGPSPLEENLRRLTDEIGGRVTGSPEMAKAVEWAVAAFRAEGVDVHTEKFTLPVTWREGETRLELLGAVKFPVHLVAGGRSPRTPFALRARLAHTRVKSAPASACQIKLGVPLSKKTS